MNDQTQPCLDKRFGKWEINLRYDTEAVINCSANQTIEIDKLYGPLAALGVRIRLEYNDKCSDWVVEREILKNDDQGNSLPAVWKEVARWDCQLDWPEDR